MNITTTTALGSVQSSILSPIPINRVGVCLDLYPKQHRNGIIFTINEGDESYGIYGPAGRKLIKPKAGEFIDFYV